MQVPLFDGVYHIMQEKRLQNEDAVSFLLRWNNFSRLKQLLDERSKKLEKLQKNYKKKALDFGSVTLFDDLSEILKQVKKDVDDFLKLENVSLPKLMRYHFFAWSTSYLFLLFVVLGLVVMASGLFLWQQFGDSWFMFIIGVCVLFLGYKIICEVFMYGSKTALTYSYSPLTQTIIVPDKKTSYGRYAELVHIIAHEYAHHLENVFGFGGLVSGKWDIIKEGFAIGIQRYAAQVYARKEDNDAFLYWVLDEEIGAMQGVYVWLSQKLNIPFAKRKKWLKTSRRPFEPVVGLKSFSKMPSIHAFGCVLFLLLEDKYGEKIYRDMLRGEFEFGQER